MPVTPMAAADQPPPQVPSVICAGALRQRDPPFFSGKGDYDVEDWLSSYERVSAYNKWDDATKLHNVPFSLEKPAILWYNNNAATMKTWADFKNNLTRDFDRPAVRKLHAEQRLRTRAQLPGENFTSYIEDVVDLCRRVNSSMSDDDKIKHIMKGVDDDTFHMLVSKNPRSVTEVIGLCQSFEELRRQRALVRHSLPTTESLSSLTFSSNQLQLEAKIKEFVREEVARQLSLVPFTEQASSSLPSALQATIREQVAEALPPANVATAAVAPLAVPQVAATVAAPLTATVAAAPAVMPMTYADCLAQPVHPSFRSFRPAIPAVAPPTLQPAPQFPPTRPPAVPYGNPWRTPDNRPICFSCCCPGHVARYCRRVASSPRVPQTSAYAARPPHHNVSSGPPPTSFSADRQIFEGRRSPSPRRRSLSPMRRHSTPTPEGN